ncbi:RNA pseudouridine synthase [Lewinellaceae bacterium SD302]|nr:RNA pseudouridine synthase [Lewinellaceae bacterium SD302]
MEEQNDEFFETFEVTTDPGQTPLRLDKFLLDKTSKLSRNRIQNIIKAGSATVNGMVVKANHRVKPGQHVKMIIPKFQDPNEGLVAEDIPLDIRYEDEHLLVLHKEPGMVVHPGIGNHSGTLVNALAHYLRLSELPVLPGNDINRVGLVHRIDKDTSGLLVIAKTEFAMSHLAKQFFDHSIERSYVALVWGSPEPADGRIETFIARDPRNRTKYAVPHEDEEEGKWAATNYKTLEDLYYVSLLELRLETGRTHQIRVHMSHRGNPLFNDAKYGGDRIHKGTVYSKYRSFVEKNFALCPRQALHAKSLSFVHPATKEKVTFTSELPEDMAAVAERFRNYLSSRRND